MSTSLIGLSNAIYAELKLHLLDDALAKIPAPERAKAEEQMIEKSKLFSMSMARSIMKCMASNPGPYPVLYCNTPGLAEISDISQIGVSSSTTVGK